MTMVSSEKLRRKTLGSRRLIPRLLSGALLLSTHWAVLGTAQSAHAQDAQALAEARSKFQRALELEQAKNFGGALKLFREVGSVKMTPQVRYHIAGCEEHLGQLVAALGGYELALATAEGMHPDFLAEVQGSIDDLKARIPKLILARGEGADAASVELDGVALGASSIGVETPLNPGPHTVRATALGYQDFQQTVTVAEGAIETLTIELLPVEKEVASATGGADGDAAGTGSAQQQSFGVLPYVLGGSGIVLLAAGGTFVGLSQGKAGKVKDLCGGTDCTSLNATDQEQAKQWSKSAHTLEGIGWAGVGVGAAALATGTVLFFIDRGREKNSPDTAMLKWSPVAPSGDWGWSVHGQF